MEESNAQWKQIIRRVEIRSPPLFSLIQTAAQGFCQTLRLFLMFRNATSNWISQREVYGVLLAEFELVGYSNVEGELPVR